VEKCPDLWYGVHHLSSTSVFASSNIPRVCWRHPYPVLARAPFNSLLLIRIRLRRCCLGSDSSPIGCSGSPCLVIGDVLNPFARLDFRTCGCLSRVPSSDTPSTYGRLLFVPFVPLELRLLLTDATFSTLSAPYDRPYLIPPPFVILLWCLACEVYLRDEEDISSCCTR